jgi:4-hydroxy-3-methylbut-2-enyl diphosphate reductase
MRVLVAEVLGMCFGVRDALKAAVRVEQPGDVTIHGELVHNEVVLDRLRARGFAMAAEDRRLELPTTETVLVTAHGISNRERARLERAGKQLLDTTCPLVTRAHEAARELQEAGYHVLVIGQPQHVEVRGIIEDLTSFDVVQKIEKVRRYESRRLGIICQTTTPVRLVDEIRRVVAERNPDAEIRFIDTVCLPTKEHQNALERLLDQVERMIVVGGLRSNNTRELVARCRARNVPAYHVQAAGDLQASWFVGVETVGLTAGTSTLDETIAEVRKALAMIGGGPMLTAEGADGHRE